MQLGIIDGDYINSFKKAKDMELEFVDFCVNVNSDVDEFFKSVDACKSESTKNNVAVGAIGRWGSNRIDESGNIISEELEISYKLIDAASILGCKNFVCGCNYIDTLSYYENCTAAIEYFKKLIDYGKQKDVLISTYNCRWNNFVCDDMAYTIIHGYLKDLGIKYDPSHSYYAGVDYLKEMAKWANRFYHVHIKGAVMIDGERVDDPPAGLDCIDWRTFMAVLYARGYDKMLSIEPHSKVWSGERGHNGILFTRDYISKLML